MIMRPKKWIFIFTIAFLQESDFWIEIHHFSAQTHILDPLNIKYPSLSVELRSQILTAYLTDNLEFIFSVQLNFWIHRTGPSVITRPSINHDTLHIWPLSQDNPSWNFRSSAGHKTLCSVQMKIQAQISMCDKDLGFS